MVIVSGCFMYSQLSHYFIGQYIFIVALFLLIIARCNFLTIDTDCGGQKCSQYAVCETSVCTCSPGYAGNGVQCARKFYQ